MENGALKKIFDWRRQETKLFWFKTIVSYLCYEDRCVAVLRGHTRGVNSVAKLNETTIVSGDYQTVRGWDLPIARENKRKREQVAIIQSSLSTEKRKNA